MGILDAVNDVRKPGGIESAVKQGTNALLSKLGASIPEGSQNIQDAYGYFLTNLLQTSNSIPLKPLWMCFLDDVPDVTTLAEEYDVNGTGGKHKFSQGFAAASSSVDFRGGKAALLAQEINIPGDSLRIDAPDAAQNMGGFLQGSIGSQREKLGTAKTAYLETNYSFTDYVLRPWMIHSAYNSLKYAKSTNITMINYGKAGKDKQFVPRKITKLWNCVPVSIDTETFNYEGDDVTLRQVEWKYDSYTMESGQYVGEGDILASLDRVFNVSFEDLKNPSNILSESRIDALTNAAVGVGANFITNLAGEAGSTIEEALGLSADRPLGITSATGNINTAIEKSIIAAGSESIDDDTISTRTHEDDVVINKNDTVVNIIPSDVDTNNDTITDAVDDVLQRLRIDGVNGSIYNDDVIINQEDTVVNLISDDVDTKERTIDDAVDDAIQSLSLDVDDVHINTEDGASSTYGRKYDNEAPVNVSDVPLIYINSLNEGQSNIEVEDNIKNSSTMQDDVQIRGDTIGNKSTTMKDDVIPTSNDSIDRQPRDDS